VDYRVYIRTSHTLRGRVIDFYLRRQTRNRTRTYMYVAARRPHVAVQVLATNRLLSTLRELETF